MRKLFVGLICLVIILPQKVKNFLMERKMKKHIAFAVSVVMVLSISMIVSAQREYVGEAVVKDNMLFINGNSVAAAQLPNEYVYIPVESLDAYGFDVFYNNDKGYKEYVVRRNGSTEFVPEFAYIAEHYRDFTKVYTTDAKVYLDSDIPANVFELEGGTVLVQSDELAKYGKYNWDVNAHTISIDFDNTGFLPVGQPFHNVLGLNDTDEIGSGVIVRNDGKCADIQAEDLKEWIEKYWDFAPYDRVIGPYNIDIHREYYIKLWTKDKQKAFIVYPNSGVIAGAYGEPCESHGEIKKNYVWYLPYVGNGRNALHIADTKLTQKYINEKSDGFINTLRDVTSDESEVIPEVNLLNTDGASHWAKAEIEKAASCNLLPYELTDKYERSITRGEFCDLIYRLIATEFSPDSDSRQGQWFVIDNVIYERQLADKINSVHFSDCNDDKINFLSGAGIIYGMGDGTFAPDELITREQAATILDRTAEFLGNKTIPTVKELQYDDEKEISEWALASVAKMKEMNIMKGVSQTVFAPDGAYTVEQAIATMLRLYNCY